MHKFLLNLSPQSFEAEFDSFNQLTKLYLSDGSGEMAVVLAKYELANEILDGMRYVAYKVALFFKNRTCNAIICVNLTEKTGNFVNE